MAEIEIAGIMRAGAYSPNHIGNDAAIFNATAEQLRKRGYVVNIYSDERKATETYDLGGRRLPEGSQQSGLLIKNGKVIFNKQK